MEVNFPDQFGFGRMWRADHKLRSLILKVAIILRCSLLITKTWRHLNVFCTLLA